LLDANKFWQYDNRESLASQPSHQPMDDIYDDAVESTPSSGSSKTIVETSSTSSKDSYEVETKDDEYDDEEFY
jgi:hypothetical protein